MTSGLTTWNLNIFVQHEQKIPHQLLQYNHCSHCLHYELSLIIIQFIAQERTDPRLRKFFQDIV